MMTHERPMLAGPAEAEQELFFRALRSEGKATIVRMDLNHERWEPHSWWILGCLVVVIGAVIIYAAAVFSNLPEPMRATLRGLGDAVVIAGVLALIVDQPLKRRLLREAARGIFKHMLGFEQQPEIRERLEQIALGTKLFARNSHAHYRFEPISDDWIRLTVMVDAEIVNPGLTPVRYQQFMQFELGERATAHSMGLVSSRPDQNYWRTDSLTEMCPGSGIMEVKAPEMKIYPNTRYQFSNCFDRIVPREFYNKHHLALPTIGIHISIEAPDDLVVRTDADNHSGNIWQTDRLFMAGESMTVRWSPVNWKEPGIDKAIQPSRQPQA